MLHNFTDRGGLFMAKVREVGAWYALRALYRADHGHKDASSVRTLLEESVLLFRSTPSSAATKGHQVAKQRQHSYKNVYGEMVRWKLHQVLEIVEVVDQPITEGSEVYHRFHLKANPDATARRLGYRTKKTIVNV
jgi:uncharacterized protein DUF4288